MMNSRVNSQFVIATLAEFVRVWDLGEDASLHLETTKGHATMAFTCKLGPPSAPHPNPTFPPPTPPPWPRHHRGPAQREKNRRRAASYQASKRAAATAVTSPTTLPTTASVVTSSTPTITSIVSTPSITAPVITSSVTVSPDVSCASSRTADSAVVPRPAEGYGSVPVDPAVEPSMDMYFNDRVKVYGFIFALVPEVKNRTGCEVQCNKCQFFGSWTLTSINFSRGLRKHREEKHRIWECLCCGASFPNKVDFKNHIERRNCVLHKFGMPYLECGSDDPIQ